MSKILYLPPFWFGRLLVALLVGVIALISAFGAETLLQRVVHASGPEGFWCVLALACLSALAVIDVCINDLLPARFSLRWAKKNRHLIYMGLAMGTASLGFVIDKNTGLNAMHALIYLTTGAAAWVAFLDLFARHRGL